MHQIVYNLFIYLFIYLFILVLPLYCYQPISLHPRAHMLSHVIPWTSARQAPLSTDFSRQDTGVGCHFLLQDYIQFKTNITENTSM